MREWWSKLARALHLRRGLDDDLSDEMRAHLELMTDDNLERGMSTSEARAAARRHFGNLTRTREKAREEIGRASCRERVEISVVGVSLKREYKVTRARA